jgi:hypothetical protein
MNKTKVAFAIVSISFSVIMASFLIVNTPRYIEATRLYHLAMDAADKAEACYNQGNYTGFQIYRAQFYEIVHQRYEVLAGR